jgi:PAS domain S-box-containing protein
MVVGAERMTMLTDNLNLHGQEVTTYLASSSNFGITLLDADLNIVDCNLGFMRLFGPRQKPIANPLHDFLELPNNDIHSGELIKLACSRNSNMEGIFHCTFVRTEAGYLLFCERQSLSESCALEQMGAMNNELLNLQRELVKKNNELEKLKLELGVSVEKQTLQVEQLTNEQRIILSTMPIGAVFIKEQKVQLANLAFEKMLGYEIGETVGMRSTDFYTNSSAYERVGNEVYATIASGKIYCADAEMKMKDGAHLWCSLVGQAVSAQNNDDISIWMIQDITDRKQAEEERLLLQQQFYHAQKLESLGVLAGGIAHDFNNILMVILGHCYVACDESDLNINVKTRILQIETAAHRAADLCRQMLTYAGKSPLLQSSVNVGLLVEDVVKMLQSAAMKNIEIELVVTHDLPNVKGDSGQIQQVVMNLIINASEAIGDKTGTIRVELSEVALEADCAEKDTFGACMRAGRYVCLEVSDHGCGMDEETQKRIFEPFYTTKLNGRGLGMSAIRGIVTSHDGMLKLTSTPGSGTSFKVYFPLQEASHATAVVTHADTLISPEKTTGLILLVDDDETLRNLGVILLELLGFSVITAQHGREALEVYRERSSEIDAILIDQMMPVMGGIEAYHELRKVAPTLPITICSGYEFESVAEVIGSDGYTSFIHKPYKLDQLRNVMRVSDTK